MYRIVFIDYLRVIAISLIVLGHFLGSFFYFHPSIATQSLFIALDNLSFSSPFTFLLSKHINAGLAGVAIFFLISGFVIPLSVKKKSPSVFLVVRFFRIYPSYIITLIIIFLLLLTNAYANGIPFPFTFSDLLANLFLVYDWFDAPPVDYAFWALLVLTKFYILAVVFHKLRRFEDGRFIFCLNLIFLTLTYFARTKVGFLANIGWNSIYLQFILLGVCFYNLFEKHWTLKKFVLIFFFIYLSVFVGLEPSSRKDWLFSFNIGLILFTALYILREKTKYSKFVHFISEISLPLYLIHRIPGYIALSILIKNGIPPYKSIAFISLLTIGMAYLLYAFVTKPFYTFGVRLHTRNK